MLKYGCLSFVLLLSLAAAGQNQLNIDSLLTLNEQQADDTLRLRTLNHIVNYYMYRDIDKAGSYIREQLALSNDITYPSGIALAHYQFGSYYYNLNQTDSAIFHYSKSLTLARKLSNSIYISQALRGLAIIAFSEGDLLKADSINDLDLANSIQANDTMGIALSYDFKGTINQNKGYYSIALDNVLKGLKLMELLGDSIRIGDGYNHLATLEMNMKNYEKGIEYNEIALKIYEAYDDVYYQAQALNDIGVMYKSLKEFEKAMDYFNRTIQKSKQAQVPSIEAAALTNIGGTYLELNQFELAIDNLKSSIDLSKSLNAHRRIAIAENRLADVYLSMDRPADAIIHASNALNYAEENENISIKLIAIEHLAQANEFLGNKDAAIQYLKEVRLLNDSILNTEKVNKIEELRVKFDLAQKEAAIAQQENEINMLNISSENDRLTKSIYATGMVSFLAISGLLYFGFSQRIKKNKLAYEKREALLQQELDFKKKELASQTLHLVKKNTFIQELKENLERLKQSPELFKIEFRRLILLLKRENAEDEEWEVFKSYFSEVHNDFDTKLKAIYSEITEKEIRLASFLRMNLSTKEIASIFSVLPDSVLKSKYRLKQKLNLDKNADLSQFLNSL